MTKNELINHFARIGNMPKVQSEIIVNQFFGAIFDALVKGERVEIRGFGSFHIKNYRARKGKNPRTGKVIEVPAKKLPFFRVGKELKEMLNNGWTKVNEEKLKCSSRPFKVSDETTVRKPTDYVGIKDP